MLKMRELEDPAKSAALVNCPLVSRKENGDWRLRSQQFPDPGKQNSDCAGKPQVCVKNGSGEVRTIELARLAEYDADGWHEWFAPTIPIDPEDEHEDRQAPKAVDAWTVDRPYEDTALWFKQSVDFSRRADRLPWGPGQLLGPDPEARATMSHAVDFL
jgi:hypothetical protein